MANDQIMKEWESFRAAVMPPNPAVNQVAEMRRAFFAGALTILELVRFVAGDDVCEEDGALMLEEMYRECVQFAKGVGGGEF